MWQYLLPAFVGLYLVKSGRVSSLSAAAQPAVLVFHAITLVALVAFLVTLSPVARFYAFLASFVSTVVALLANFGTPGRSNYQMWLAQASQSADFSFFMFSSIFLSAQTVGIAGDVLGLLVVSRRALWALGLAVEKVPLVDRVVVRKSQDLWRVLRAYEKRVMLLMALFEISIGFYLIALLLTPARQIFTIFVYWNFLRLRFNAARSRSLHVEAWKLIESRFQPITRVELVRKVVEKVQSWFHQ